jgi:hypothetical protein
MRGTCAGLSHLPQESSSIPDQHPLTRTYQRLCLCAGMYFREGEEFRLLSVGSTRGFGLWNEGPVIGPGATPAAGNSA